MDLLAKGSLRLQSQGGKKEELPSISAVQGLQEKNSKLARDLQQQKLTNAQLLDKVVRLSEHVHNISAENNRFKQSVGRINVYMKDFVPLLVKCSDLLSKVVEETELVNSASSISQPLNRSQYDSFNRLCVDKTEENSSRSPESTMSQRTGIAKPIIQGHTISKPSVSLQRFHHILPIRCPPAPVRGLHVADILAPADSSLNEGLSDIIEEEENGVILPLPPLEGPTEQPSPPEEMAPLERNDPSESAEELILVTEKLPVASSNGTSRRETKVVLEEKLEEFLESSDDEAIELSLIESRRQLANYGRRKDLKEGTSQDYVDLDHDSPGGVYSRKRRKRRAKKATPPGSPGGSANDGITAARKSINGLLNSLNQTAGADDMELDSGSPERVTIEVVESPSRRDTRRSLPRVNITRLKSERRRSSPEGSASVQSAETEIIPNGGVPEDDAEDVLPKIRNDLVTTRKRSARTMTTSTSSDEERPGAKGDAYRRTSRKVPRRSWTAVTRRKSKCSGASEKALTEEVPSKAQQLSPSKSPPSEAERRTNQLILQGELPTVVLQRCSDGSIEENLLREKAVNSSNDGTEMVSVICRNGGGITNGFAEDRKSGSQNKSKPRSRPKARSRPRKAAPKKSSDSRKSSESRGELDISKGKTSFLSDTCNSISSCLDADVSGDVFVLTSSGRPRRCIAPVSLKEKPLNVKMRRH